VTILRKKTMRKMAIKQRHIKKKKTIKMKKRRVSIRRYKKILKVDTLIKITKKKRSNRKLRNLVCRDCN
jgi:hypothetical protein